jgi:hypothetical protein
MLVWIRSDEDGRESNEQTNRQSAYKTDELKLKTERLLSSSIHDHIILSIESFTKNEPKKQRVEALFFVIAHPHTSDYQIEYSQCYKEKKEKLFGHGIDSTGHGLQKVKRFFA